jgi:hypothetical protein
VCVCVCVRGAKFVSVFEQQASSWAFSDKILEDENASSRPQH